MKAPVTPIRPETRVAKPVDFIGMFHAAIAQGAVAMMVVFELPDGTFGRLAQPDLVSVKRGLSEASWMMETQDDG